MTPGGVVVVGVLFGSVVRSVWSPWRVSCSLISVQDGNSAGRRGSKTSEWNEEASLAPCLASVLGGRNGRGVRKRKEARVVNSVADGRPISSAVDD